MNTNRLVYIILPVYNRRKITENFVNQLLVQTFQNYRLILIDDGSTDGTSESIRKNISPEKLIIIKGKGKWWWAGSLQQGYQWLVINNKRIDKDDSVLIINDDVAIQDDFLIIGNELLDKYRNTLLLAQCYDDSTKEIIDVGINIDWKKLHIRQAINNDEITCLSTRGLFFRVKDFFKIGGFYPKLLPHYLSDYEFTLRAKNKGFKLMTDPLLKLYSDESTTGYRSHTEKNVFVFLKKAFSKRSNLNPIYWITFVLLACPSRYRLKHVILITLGFIKNTFKHIIRSI